MNNITLFIGGLSGGGAERVITNIANYLFSKGYNVTLLTMADDEPSYPVSSGVQRVSLLRSPERKGFLLNSFKRFRRLFRYVKSENVDAYIVMLPATILLLLLLKPFFKAPVIISERSNPRYYGFLTKLLLRRMANRANCCVCQTPDIATWYTSVMPANKVCVIPNAINTEIIRPLFEGERDLVIVTVGRLIEVKNQALLIRAFAQIHDQFSQYKLVIYGEGELREKLISLVNDNNLNDCVLLPGYSLDLADKIRSASLFVLSSNYEGMPNALIEAMALGLPCVSTDCEGGGASFLIENGRNGILVPRGDASALSEAMLHMLTDKNFAKQCGNEAYKIGDRLSPDIIYGQWEKTILTVS